MLIIARESMPNTSTDLIILDSQDNVATLCRTLKSGTKALADHGYVDLRQTVPGGHKVSLKPVASGGKLIKYGQIIGFAKVNIEPGEWVHTHNVELKEVSRNYDYSEKLLDKFPKKLDTIFFVCT